jgi:hypothetical protein
MKNLSKFCLHMQHGIGYLDYILDTLKDMESIDSLEITVFGNSESIDNKM